MVWSASQAVIDFTAHAGGRAFRLEQASERAVPLVGSVPRCAGGSAASVAELAAGAVHGNATFAAQFVFVDPVLAVGGAGTPRAGHAELFGHVRTSRHAEMTPLAAVLILIGRGRRKARVVALNDLVGHGPIAVLGMGHVVLVGRHRGLQASDDQWQVFP